jgi:hypothetical protein
MYARLRRSFTSLPVALSQLLALEDDSTIAAKLLSPAPEQFWRLAPPPEGWEGLAD